MNRCPYCNNRKDLFGFDYSMSIDGLVDAYLSTNVRVIDKSLIVSTSSYDEDGVSTGIHINYCPMCGRKLTKEHENERRNSKDNSEISSKGG